MALCLDRGEVIIRAVLGYGGCGGRGNNDIVLRHTYSISVELGDQAIGREISRLPK